MEDVTVSSAICSWWLYHLVPIPIIITKDQPMAGALLSICWIGGVILATVCAAMAIFCLSPGGIAWAGKRTRGEKHIPGPRGWPVLGSLMHMTTGLAHRNLAELASRYGATRLMAFSLGSTPVVITSDPDVARELLSSPCFADRPVKQSARELMFERAMGFAPSGDYWRMLRRISATHLFAPRRIVAHEIGRQADALKMLQGIRDECCVNGFVKLRLHLQEAALNNIMGTVFGKRFDVGSRKAAELRNMVEEGFQLLGEFNWADHLPWLRPLDPLRIHRRCAKLVPRVRSFVKSIIDEHRSNWNIKKNSRNSPDADFVDVLLSLQGDSDKLHDDDMIAVLWEMIFRGTDTTALLTEWTMAEVLLNDQVQSKVQEELDAVVGRGMSVRDEDIPRLPYLQAVVKETLRMHPPGPLLSWARLATRDVQLTAEAWRVPAGTTAMVNMWAITHDPNIWNSPFDFRPERFLDMDVDVRGSDLRLAPFGGGRRVCPGKGLGLVTVHLWVAKLLHHFTWSPSARHPVDLSEVLKLSCQMTKPLTAIPVVRTPF